MNMKLKVLLFSIVISAGSFLFPLAANAEQCLAQYPDSAWANGVPNGVAASKDPLLMEMTQTFTKANGEVIANSSKYDPQYGMRGTIVGDSDYIYKDDKVSLDRQVTSQTPITTTYTYQGSNCSTRTVSVQSFFKLIPLKVIEKSDSNFQTELKNVFNQNIKNNLATNLNFAQKNYLDQGISDFIDWLANTEQNPVIPKFTLGFKSSIPLAPVHNYGFDPQNEGLPDQVLYSLYAQKGIDIRSGLFYGMFGEAFSSPKTIFLDDCAVSNGSGTASPWQPTKLLYWGNAIYFLQNVPSCKAVVIMQTSTGNWAHVGDEVFQNPTFKKAEPTPTPVPSSAPMQGSTTNPNASQSPNTISTDKSVSGTSNKSVSIACIKGKILKKVTGLNPKCPAGYKKK